MRRKRAQLSNQELQLAAVNIAKHARQCFRILNTQRILSYAPFAGEASPDNISLSANANIYLPRITNYSNSNMRFYRSRRSQVNQYGIREPQAVGEALPANAFDVILLPLVAFDRAGTRLGMGSGFYDRALAALAHQISTRPYLVGVAHHFQEVNSLTPAPWDVPLDAILTDHEFIEVM